MMVACASGYYSESLRGFLGITQGETLSLTIFNVVVDEVARKWFIWWREAQEDQTGGRRRCFNDLSSYMRNTEWNCSLKLNGCMGHSTPSPGCSKGWGSGKMLGRQSI